MPQAIENLLACTCVWVQSAADRSTFAASPADAAPAVGGFVVTNEPEALRELTPAATLLDIAELQRLAFPLSGAETITQMLAEHDLAPAPPLAALVCLWQVCAAQLAALPFWALEQMELLRREANDVAVARLLGILAAAARRVGEKCKAWHDTFPADGGTSAGRSPPLLADCTPLTAERLIAAANINGALSQVIPGYEVRPGQLAMIGAVTGAINEGKHLLIEAGTGVGKSIGYLLPAVSWAMLNDTPVVVSTNTRNLQTQLIEKDIPLIRTALGADQGRELRAVVLKGRANYLCLRHFGVLLDQGLLTLDRGELRQFSRVVSWAARSADGDLDALSGGCGMDSTFLSTLGSQGEECAGRTCRFFRRCFVRRARERAAQAHVVVANHALVFVDSADTHTTLPEHRQLVFDEAHNLEDAATRHFSIEISAARLRLTLRRIHSEQKGRASGLLENLRKQIEQGMLARHAPRRDELHGLVREARVAMAAVRLAGDAFFIALPLALDAAQAVIRLRGATTAAAAAAAPPAAEIGTATAFAPWGEERGYSTIIAAAQRFEAALRRAATLIEAIAPILRAAQENELGLYADQVCEVSGAATALKMLAGDLCFALAAASADYVYWIARGRTLAHTARGRRRRDIEEGELWAAPLRVGPLLEERIYRRKESVIFCSATLRAGDRFDFMAGRIGIDRIEPERLATCIAGSPFDYARQCEVLATPFLPEPRNGHETAAYVEQLAALLLDVLVLLRGRSLVLFTSYQMMRQCADLLRDPLATAQVRLLEQAKGVSRDQITRTFRSGGAAALFGAQSFWEGVDVVGEALSCVIMVRLPFLAVGDPVVEARCEQIDAAGGSSFNQLTAPTAVIRFRQGFGRLIRSTSDRGLVIVTDPRLTTKGYGRRFVSVLPCPVRALPDREALLARIKAFCDTP